MEKSECFEHKNEPVCYRPFLATDTASDFPVLDVCILCVKAYDLKNVLEQLKDKITLYRENPSKSGSISL